MKTTATILLCLLATAFCRAQNLVLNPSFEEYDTCPDFLGQITRANGWYSARPSPDYYNLCVSTQGTTAPSNFYGYQFPNSGSGYAGLASMYGGVSELREYIGTKLIDTLKVGNTYFVSFVVSRAYNQNHNNDCASNKIGALFSVYQYTDTNLAPVCGCAQVYADEIISDSIGWTRLKFAFQADSNYQYLNIGNFFNSSFTDSIQYSGSFCNAYYYIDDVCVSTDSTYAYSYNFNSISEVENSISPIQIHPNPATTKLHCNNHIKATLYSLCGEAVKELDFTQGNEVDVTEISNGVYVVSYEYEGRRYSVKQVVMH